MANNDHRHENVLYEIYPIIFREAETGIVVKGVDGKMLDFNPAFQAMLGYQVDEIRQHDYLEIIHPLDRSASRRLFNELVSGKRKNYTIEKRYLSKDGQVVWGRTSTSLVRGIDGEAQYAIGMVENITTQKQIEAELVELQSRLMQGREMERLRVAQDLHDGPLQELIALAYQVQTLENAMASAEDREQLQAIQKSLHLLTRSIRSICGELRPPTLIPFGLEKAITSHVEEFCAAHPEVEIKIDLAKDAKTLPENIRIMLFRIYQEALNNVMRHSQATIVWVRFTLAEGEAVLDIQDNGVGFELPGRWITLARQGHLGLVGARERAKELGGSLEIVSAPGEGTSLHVVVPLGEETVPITGKEVKS